MTTLGAVFRPQLAPERLRAVVRSAEDAGLDELWLWEDCFREGGISTAAAALAWTERVRIGVGLLPVPLRNVAVTAMEAATLHRMFPGRAVLGVGHGVQDWMGQVGARVESPVRLLREHLVALRALLRGERLTVDGRYVTLDDVALDWPPEGRSRYSPALPGRVPCGSPARSPTAPFSRRPPHPKAFGVPGVSSRRGVRRPGVRPRRTQSSSISSPPPDPAPTSGSAPS